MLIWFYSLVISFIANLRRHCKTIKFKRFQNHSKTCAFDKRMEFSMRRTIVPIFRAHNTFPYFSTYTDSIINRRQIADKTTHVHLDLHRCFTLQTALI